MSEIRLEVGKKYLNRKGEEKEIAYHNKLTNFPYEDSEGRSYTSNGRWVNDEESSELDLAKEVLPESNSKTMEAMFGLGGTGVPDQETASSKETEELKLHPKFNHPCLKISSGQKQFILEMPNLSEDLTMELHMNGESFPVRFTIVHSV